MAANVAHKFRTGLKPQAFIEGMTKNQDTFQNWSEAFAWADEQDQAFLPRCSIGMI